MPMLKKIIAVFARILSSLLPTSIISKLSIMLTYAIATRKFVAQRLRTAILFILNFIQQLKPKASSKGVVMNLNTLKQRIELEEREAQKEYMRQRMQEVST